METPPTDPQNPAGQNSPKASADRIEDNEGSAALQPLPALQGTGSGGTFNEGRAKAPPPASKVVIEATKTEAELRLEKELEAERVRVKALEGQVAEGQDRLRTLLTPADPGDAPAKKQKASWIQGTTMAGMYESSGDDYP